MSSEKGCYQHHSECFLQHFGTNITLVKPVINMGVVKHVGPVSFGAGWLLCCSIVGSKPRKLQLQNGFTKAVQMEGVAAVPDSRRGK